MALVTTDFAGVAHGTIAHLATTATVSTPDATSDSTCATLLGALRTSFAGHFSDGSTAHTAADTVTTLYQLGVGLSIPVQLNNLVGALEQHAQIAGIHVTPDHANAQIGSTYAVPTESYCWRRANALKAAWNAHLASALAST